MISESRLETSGALMRESPHAHSPLQAILGGSKRLATQTRKISCALTNAFIPFFLVREPCWRKGSTWESPPPYHPPQHENLKETVVRNTEHLPIRALFLLPG